MSKFCGYKKNRFGPAETVLRKLKHKNEKTL